MSSNFDESLDQDEIDKNKENHAKKRKTLIICLIIIIIMMLPSTLAFLAIF
jgi:flagellar basal body-associated protein FliL